MKLKVLAWIFCLSLIIQLISCKKVQLHCVENAEIFDKLKLDSCYAQNSCIYLDVDAEKDDTFHIDENDKNCIIFINSTLYTIPPKLLSRNGQTIFAANLSLEVLPEMDLSIMETLIFKNNNLKKIPDSFKIRGLIIDYSNNQISTIEDNLFFPLNSQQESKINFSKNQLEFLSLEVVSNEGVFNKHDFSENKIKEIQSSSSYIRYSHQTSFNFSKNRFQVIPVNIFKQYKIMGTLDLSYNKIEMTNTSAGKLVQKVDLEVLNLSFNKIKEFSFKFLEFFNKLTKLDVSNNHIEFFEDNQYKFNDQIRIGEIIMNNNKIKIMPATIFSQRYIIWDLTYNLIEMFSDYDDKKPIEFYRVVVNTIDLSYNKLEIFPIKAFSTVKIRKLILNNNQISYFNDFATLLVTETLDLSYNLITTIPFETFTNSSLKNLILNNNEVNLDFGIFPKDIQMIDLRFNKLSITLDLFSFYEKLNTIYLDNNESIFIDFDDLKFSNIRKIGISRNNHQCNNLLILLMTLKNAGYVEYVLNNPFVYDSRNINGIECN